MSDMEAIPPDQATIPWHRAKQMLKRAWDEGFADGLEYAEDNDTWANEFGPIPSDVMNPYDQED